MDQNFRRKKKFDSKKLADDLRKKYYVNKAFAFAASLSRKGAALYSSRVERMQEEIMAENENREKRCKELQSEMMQWYKEGGQEPGAVPPWVKPVDKRPFWKRMMDYPTKDISLPEEEKSIFSNLKQWKAEKDAAPDASEETEKEKTEE